MPEHATQCHILLAENSIHFVALVQCHDNFKEWIERTRSNYEVATLNMIGTHDCNNVIIPPPLHTSTTGMPL